MKYVLIAAALMFFLPDSSRAEFGTIGYCQYSAAVSALPNSGQNIPAPIAVWTSSCYYSADSGTCRLYQSEDVCPANQNTVAKQTVVSCAQNGRSCTPTFQSQAAPCQNALLTIYSGGAPSSCTQDSDCFWVVSTNGPNGFSPVIPNGIGFNGTCVLSSPTTQPAPAQQPASAPSGE